MANAGWVPTGSLITARSLHTATLLPNGKVLAVGGRGAGGILASVELYDPASGTWSAAAPLGIARVGHTATLLSDGRVLVTGGGDDTSSSPPNFSITDSAELYDPDTDTWTPTGRMSKARAGHTATLLQDGRVLVAAGFNTAIIDTAELYDPVTGTWSATGRLNVARYWHTATLLQDGRVLVAKGSNDGDLASALPDGELYDPSTGRWTYLGASNAASVFHTATLLPDGKVLFAGGNGGGVGGDAVFAVSELFDPATSTWTRAGDLAAKRYGHAAVLLPDGTVLVVGGVFQIGHYPSLRYSVLGSTERFDPNTATWSNAATLQTTRTDHTATALGDGRVLVTGGRVVGPNYIEIPQSSSELFVAGVSSPGTIGAGFTGTWYDPAQSGHGLLIEVLTDNRFYATWFAFNPTGTGQAWFTGVGTYSNNTATITDVRMLAGGRWIPNFDPNQVRSSAWGTLTFTFTDCNHGRVDFDSVAGYGTGSMNLTRLTQPAGLTCP